MKVSRNWISEFVNIRKNINLESELTQLGLEVDSIKKSARDDIIDIEFTPNRGDCLSVMGTSRDLAAHKNKKILLPQASPYKVEKEKTCFNKISQDICPEYRLMEISNININKQTPRLIKDRLNKSDISIVNPIVDISNYVMIEIGQPTHAFDKDKINGKLSIIRVKKKCTFTGVNNKKYNISIGTPVIIDDNNIIHALPGVMGSKVSSVTKDTRNILFESAFFIPDTVRLLSREYRIQTDSSYRFERGVDFKLQEFALSRIHYILNTIIPLESCKLKKITHSHISTKQKSFKYDPNLYKRILGIELSQNKIKSIINSLGFSIKSNVVTVPSYRFDIFSNYDLVEEVSRMIGYNDIKETPLRLTNIKNKKNNNYCSQLVTLGYKEVINFTFISQNYSNKNNHLALDNPISKDKSIMRDSLIPGLLKNINYNQNRQHKSIRLFETGKIYAKDKTKIIEPKVISGVLFGLRSSHDLVCNQYSFGIDDVKADILSLFPNCVFKKNSDSIYFDSNNSLRMTINDKCVGEFGLVRADCIEAFDIKDDVFAFEIYEDKLSNASKISYSEISPFPAVFKDITLITKIDDNISYIIEQAQKNSYKYMKNIRIKDIFIDSDNLQLNNRNVTLEICLQSDVKTLSDNEIIFEIKQITNYLKDRHKISIKEAQ